MSTEIAEYSPTAAALAELRQKYEQAVFDTTTPNGMAKAIAARRELREVRVNLEKLRKELKAPALERSRLIDAEAKTLTIQIEEMEVPIDQQIKVEEQRKADEKAERERIEREKMAELQKRVANIREQAVSVVGKSSHAVAEIVRLLSSLEIDQTFGPLQAEAYAAKAETLATLADMHTAALAQEAEAERIRIEREELEAQRKAQAEQAERDRAELAKLREEVAARQAAAKAEMEKQMEEERQKVAAERAAILKEFEANQKLIDEQERLRNKMEAQARAEDEARTKSIRDAEQAEIDRQRAEIEEQRRQVEAENSIILAEKEKIKTGYQALLSFVERFGSDKEFAVIAKQITRWLDGKNEQVAA